MDTLVQGEGRFLIAQHRQPGTMFFRNPTPQGDDLTLRPWSGSVIDETWMNVPHFVRAVQNGTVALTRSDSVPLEENREIAPEYEKTLDDSQKHLIRLLCHLSLSEQLKDAINVGNLIGKNGIPKQGVRVTKGYLQEKHLPMLRAALELEGRWQNRSEVKRELNKAIKKIEAM